MLRTFRAFAWIRWRTFVNSLERTGARDTLERLSLATEKLGPLVAFALLIPSMIASAVLALVAGYGAATGEWILPLQIIRLLLIIPIVFAVLGPVVRPAGGTTNLIRYLLLPIPRRILYMAHAAGALTDPWILVMVPIVLLLPVGMAAGGASAGALAALVAGTALLGFLIGLTSLASSIVQLLLRNRRRGEIVMLVLVLVLPWIGFLPAALHADRERGGRGRTSDAPAWMQQAPRALSWTPSELYVRSVRQRASARTSAVAGLLAFAAGIQILAFIAFRRQLDLPSASGARRAEIAGGLWTRELAGLGAAGSAVAFTQLRLALRTPRGRSILAGPLLIFLVFTVLMRRGIETFPGLPVGSGVSLAVFGSFLSLVSILPFAVNQFAIDGPGFARCVLAPIDLRAVLRGKAAGNALVVLGPALCCTVLAVLAFPSGHPAFWTALPLALANTYLLAAPAAAALSAVFPREVDLNAIGNGSNAHQAAALLGLIVFAAAAAPNALITLMATGLFHEPWLTPILLLGWGVVVYALSRVLFVSVTRLVASRIETLARF
ncbi:MAG TPA: hypothetical protein VFK20_05875 [Vicinamibacterales bacterium]|nr:hypothetical protein [Vicinamibacterales bacterium]